MTAEPKPLIGLTGRRKKADQVAGFPPKLGDIDVDLYIADYSRDVLAAGGLPVLLPIDGDPTEYLPHLDGVLLSGGADLEPALYGQEPDGNGAYEPRRDTMELALLAGAWQRGLPVLGICRGLQVVNVAAGGSLHQHVAAHACFDVAPDSRVHPVSFEPGTTLADLYRDQIGDRDEVSVNSLHHQTVDRVGPGLQVAARSDDGAVEGLESDDGVVLAVQWHPEMLQEPEPVFDWLVGRARSTRSA